MIFDSWGGLLNTENYEHFSLNPMKQIISNLRKNAITKNIPIILFTKGGGGRRVAIIVPFRDEHSEQSRSNHLAQFMSYMLSYMCQSLVPFHIYIVEQSHGDGRK